MADSAAGVPAPPIAMPDRPDVASAEVVSPAEAKLRADSGNFLADGRPGPRVVVVDTQAKGAPRGSNPQPNPKSTGNYFLDKYGPAAGSQDDLPPRAVAPPTQPKAAPKVATGNYFLDKYGATDSDDSPPPAAPKSKYSMGDGPPDVDDEGTPLTLGPEAPPSALERRATSLAKGAGEFGMSIVQFANLAAATPTMLVDKIHSLATGMPHTELQDAYFKAFVDPVVATKQSLALPQDADFTDKLLHGIGGTAAMIAAALATGGAAAIPEEAGATVAGRAATGVGQMTAPAAVNAVDTGKRVYDATGDAKAAATAASASYVINALSGAIPMAVGGKVLTRVATGAAIGPVLGEASRRVQNAAMPDTLQQPFDKEDALVNTVTGAMFGLMPHGTPGEPADALSTVDSQTVPTAAQEVREQPSTAMDHAQIAAASIARAAGGDALDQVVASTHANATVGGYHDAALYEGHQQTRLAQAAQEAEVERQAAEQAAKDQAPGVAYSRREQALEDAKDADYTKALNQRGDQDIANADNLNLGIEKGTEGTQAPTLADSLSPDQLQVFKTLAARRNAEMERGELPPPQPDEKVMPFVESKTKPAESIVGTEAPKTLQERRAAGTVEAPGGKPAAEPATEPRAALTASSEESAAPTNLAARRAALTEALSPESQRIAHKFASDKAFDQDSNYQRLMQAKPGGHEALTTGMPIEEAQSHLDRLNAPAKAALENRIASRPIETEKEPASEINGQTDAFRLAGHETALREAGDSNPSALEEQQQRVLEGYGALPRQEYAPGAARPIGGLRAEQRALGGDEVVDELPPRKPQTLADRRAQRQFVNQQKGRFADSAPSARPEDQVHTRLADGSHLVETPGDGSTRAVERPNGNLKITDTSTPLGLRGRGSATARMEKLAQVAAAKGGRLESDTRVSAPAQRVYENLRARGYDIKENPSATNAAGEKVSASELKPVYEVGPKKIMARDSAPANLSERRAQKTAPGEHGAITKEAATQRLQPLIDKVGADRLKVHDSINDEGVPQNIRDDAHEFNHPDPRGAFDPSDGSIHVFAGAKGHADLEDIHDTAVHELAHAGVRSFLGDDYSKVMQDIADNIYDRQSALRSPIDGIAKTTAKNWMADYLSQHGMDPRNARHAEIAADEYVAHLAERDASDPNHENPSILRRAIDAVRAGLRKLGVIHEWTDNDIRRLLRESNNNTESEHARAAAEYRGKGLRWADSDDRTTERFDSQDPRAQAHKFGLTMEAQADHNPGYVKSRPDALEASKDWFGDAKDWTQERGRESVLATAPLRNIPDFTSEKLMPAAREFVRTRNQRAGRRGQFAIEDAPKLEAWRKWAGKNPEHAAHLDELMHESTLAGTDPSKTFEHLYSDEERAANPLKAAADEARRSYYLKGGRPKFNSLDAEGRKIYQDIRDSYKQRRADFFNALEKRAQDLGMNEGSRKQLMTLLRQRFEAGKVADPYFPLKRYGDRWGVVRNADGTTASYSRFETKAQQDKWVAAMRRQGFDGMTADGNLRLDHGQKLADARSEAQNINPQFVKKVMDLAGDIKDPAFADAVWQKYLESLPDNSFRKTFMHRAGRYGFSGSAMRAFAAHSDSSARAISGLEYDHQLDAKHGEIVDQARQIESDAARTGDPRMKKEAEWAAAISREMGLRKDWIKNHSSHWIADAITSAGFHFYLGAAPATAARILTQNFIQAPARLGAFHGQLGAWRELSRAMGQWAKSRGSFGDTLRGDERQAFDEANENGIFQNNYSNTMTSAARGDPFRVASDLGPARKALGRVAMVSHFLFNGVENLNRQTTHIAAYRLGRMQGMNHAEASEHAMNLAQDTHYDYATESKPRILQGNIQKVVGMYQQYRLNTIYRLSRDFRDMTNSSLPPEERAVAAKTFAGMLGYGSLFFGTVGLPVLSQAILGAASTMLSTKDHPVDAKAEAHAWLQQHIGRFGADSVMTGLVGAATRAALSSGTSFADLIYRSPDRDESPQQRATDFVASLTGPLGSSVIDAWQGASLLADGQVERAVEHFLPMAARGPLKAFRFAKEGVRAPGALPGNEIVPKDQLSPWDVALQAGGMTPQKVADQYAVNSAEQNAKSEIENREMQIIRHYALADAHGDTKETKLAEEEAEQFSNENPGVPFWKDYRAYTRSQSRAQHGVSLPKGLQGIRQEYEPQEDEAESAQQ